MRARFVELAETRRAVARPKYACGRASGSDFFFFSPPFGHVVSHHLQRGRGGGEEEEPGVVCGSHKYSSSRGAGEEVKDELQSLREEEE